MSTARTAPGLHCWPGDDNRDGPCPRCRAQVVVRYDGDVPVGHVVETESPDGLDDDGVWHTFAPCPALTAPAPGSARITDAEAGEVAVVPVAEAQRAYVDRIYSLCRWQNHGRIGLGSEDALTCIVHASGLVRALACECGPGFACLRCVSLHVLNDLEDEIMRRIAQRRDDRMARDRKQQVEEFVEALAPDVLWELRSCRCAGNHVKAEAIVAAILLERLRDVHGFDVPNPPGPELPGMPYCAACHLADLRADGLVLLGRAEDVS